MVHHGIMLVMYVTVHWAMMLAMSMVLLLMSMRRLLYAYTLLMDLATGAVNAHFLIRFKRKNLHADFFSLYRYFASAD